MKKVFFGIVAAGFLLTGCASHYEVSSVTRSRILVDKSYESDMDGRGMAFLAPYKKTVDSIMSPVVGHVADYMYAEKPESNLSNLLCDILVWAGKNYGEKPEFSLYNMGGMRAALSPGEVTYGNVLDVAPFENKICFFDLKGSDVQELFEQVAKIYGEGVSKGVELVITKKGELKSAKLHGEPIDPNRTYRVASIDYLAEGNGGLTALMNKTNVNSPQDASNNSRFVIMDYFREMDAQGKVVTAKVEGRIKVVE